MVPSKPPYLPDLNDDCLLEILQYLSVYEAFSLLGVFGCRFDEVVFKRIALLKHLNISLRDPPAYTPSQFEIIGRHLVTLNLSVGYSLSSDHCIKQLLGPLCKNGTIQSLTLHYVQFNTGYQICILNVCNNLRTLDLSFCQLTDEFLRPILESCLQLETFVAIANYELKGQSFHSIKSGNMKSITFEINDLSDCEIYRFIAKNPAICVKVFKKYRCDFTVYHQGQVNPSS